MSKGCRICDNTEAELILGVCNKCIEKSKNLDNAYNVGRTHGDVVEVNGFLSFCFSKKEIDDILYGEFLSYSKKMQKKFINDYCDGNMSRFIKGIKKK